MLIIKTTDSQILISKDGEIFEGVAKNSIRYKPAKDQLVLYLVNSTTVLTWEYWNGGIKINDTDVTRNNVNESLEELFLVSQASGIPEFSSALYDISLSINKKKINEK